MTEQIDLNIDPLAETLVPKGARDSNAVVLTGLIGRASMDGRVRLYRAPDMRDFVEFDKDAVLQTQKTQSEMIPGSGTVVWLRSDARLEHHASGSRHVAAEFLSGGIVEDHINADSFVDPGGQPAITWTVTVTVTILTTTTLLPRPKCDNTHNRPHSATSRCLCPD